MKAQIKPRIDLENRTKLEEIIPLRTPFVLQIEPTNYCNLKCKFCPVGDKDLLSEKMIQQGMLSLENFKKAIDDLSEFEEKIKTLHLYGNGEPLINKNFYKMVEYAKESGFIEKIDTTTNGLLLDPQKCDLIIKAGLDKINISVNGLTSVQYSEITRTSVNVNKFLDNLKYLYEHKNNCEILIKSISELYNQEEKAKFFDIFSPYTDYIFLENLTDPWPNHKIEESIQIKSRGAAFGNVIEAKKVCASIFYTMVINFDGTVSICCIDWQNKAIIGNLKKNSLKEIWNSTNLYNYQINHLKGKRDNFEICKNCNQISQCIVDNIDPYMEHLAEKLKTYREKNISEGDK